MIECALILEQTSHIPRPELKIINESIESDKPRVTFEATLQTAGANRNKRVYTRTICESIVSQLSPKAKSKQLLAEVDHPMFIGTNDPGLLKKRAGVISLQNCGAVIEDISFDGRRITGRVSTLSGFKGPDLASVIIEDGIDIGFSLRALGKLSPRSDGLMEVTQPIKAITYDIVTNPSHQDARILKITAEDQQLTDEDISLLESAGIIEGSDEEILMLQENGITINTGNDCRFFDDLLREIFRISSRKVRFF